MNQNRTRYFPAEWEPQSAVLITWPHPNSVWNEVIELIEQTYIDIATKISQSQTLLIVCYNQPHQTHVQTQLKVYIPNLLHNIHFAICPSNDTWIRDYGPLCVIDHQQTILLDFEFNAWGGKYDYTLDNAISKTLFHQGYFQSEIQSIPFVLEGGSIESDGHGTVITTTDCLLNKNRNPSADRNQIEDTLKTHLSIQRILWIENNMLIGDDTDGHIDNLLRFVDKETITYLKCYDTNDEHYPVLSKLEQEIQSFTTLEGKPYHLVPLPLPKAVYNKSNKRLAASYLNFLLINQAVLFPLFNRPEDDQVKEVMSTLFPSRKILGVNSLTLIEQNGGIHCATLQLPKGVITQKNEYVREHN